MGFFDFLKSKTSTQDAWKKTLIKDLVMLTAIDGEMNEDEIKLVLNIAVNEMGFSEKEFINLMNNLGNVENIYPENFKDKLEFLASLLRLTYTDGILDDNELEYMKIIAKRMHLPENLIYNAIANVKKSSEEDSTSDNSSVGKIIITSNFNPTVDTQSEEGAKKYLKKISNLTRPDLCIELCNVMAAKYNLTAIPSGINSFLETQKIVTDLTDKALYICMHVCGQQAILQYCNQNTRQFNQMLNEIDQEIAKLNLSPIEHGNKILLTIQKFLSAK